MRKEVLVIVSIVAFLACTSNAVMVSWGPTDISSEAGYESWIHGDVDYTSAAGYGWTNNPSPVYAYPGMIQYDKGTGPRYSATANVDARSGSVVLDAYTFRVDLPNGIYDVDLGYGVDFTTQLKTVLVLGDDLTATGAVDESTAALVGKPGASGYAGVGVWTHEGFEVTKGYLLIGFRSNEPTSLLGGAINHAVITAVPEPATVILLGIGGLLAAKKRKVA